MADKRDKETDDEYQFPEDEYVTDTESESESESSESDDHEFDEDEDEDEGEDADSDLGDMDMDSLRSRHEEDYASFSKPGLLERFPILQNKRVLAVIGLAVVVIIIFKIMTPSRDTMKPVKKSPVVQTQAIVPQKFAQQGQDVSLSTLDRLSKDVADSRSALAQLQPQLDQLKTSINTANSNGDEMRTAVVALAQQVQGLAKQLQILTRLAEAEKQRPPAPMVTYRLVAFNSGRAWIMGSNGESDTVTVGSKLQNYGVVKAIDTQAGKVITSSGKVITYSAAGN